MKKLRRTIPEFALYGESRRGRAPPPELHVEEIQTRSRKYRWDIAPHLHAELAQCVFIYSGPAGVSLDSDESAVSGPALVIIPPRTVHAFHFDQDTLGFVLTLSVTTLLGSSAAAFEATCRKLFAESRLIRLEAHRQLPTRLFQLFSQLQREFHQPDSSEAPVCLHLTRALLWLIAREVHDRAEIHIPLLRQHHQFERFQSLLESNYRQHWTVARYGRALGMTAARLTRLCTGLSGRTAFDLIQRRLLLEAQRRLTYTALSVNQITQELGFSDPAYFCRFFRRRTRLSPKRFRRLPRLESALWRQA